jgi:hypothetical protein
VLETTDGSGGVVRSWNEADEPVGELVSFTVSFTSVFTGPPWDQPQHSRSTLRFLTAERLGELLTAAGLVIERQYGDWSGQPLRDTSPEIITVARRV